MKVYVKKREYIPLLPSLIITTIFLTSSIFIFYKILSAESIIKGISEMGLATIFGTVFFIFGLFFLISLIKIPKRYTGKLIAKKEESYKGKDITYMVFQVEKEVKKKEDHIPSEYYCFTYGNNDLIVNNFYNVHIKEVNWKIKRVTEKKEEKIIKIANNISNTFAMTIIFYVFQIAFLIAISVILYEFITNKEHTILYLLWIAIPIGGMLLVRRVHLQYLIDNNERYENYDFHDKLKKYKVLKENNVKVTNLIQKDLVKQLVILPILWISIIGILTNYKWNSNIYLYIPLIFLEIITIIRIIRYNNYDNRLIKKYGLNRLQTDIKNINQFTIMRPTHNLIFEKYFIIDSGKNELIYNVQKTGLVGVNYIIYTQDGKEIAKIKSPIVSNGTIEYIVRPINHPPYMIRSKIKTEPTYEINGLKGYSIEGFVGDHTNYIVDQKSNRIAYLETLKEKSGYYSLGNTSITLNNHNNDINILLISLCITMGNFHFISKRNHN